jgi:hypothetical protein
MAEEEPDKADVLQKLDEIKSMAQTNPELISQHIFHGMNYLAELLLAKGNDNGKTGGGEDNNDKALRIFMSGGSMPSVGATMVLPSGYMDSLKEVSIDKTYELIKKKLKEIDEANVKLADIVGPRAFIDKELNGHDLMIGPFPPYIPQQIPIPKNTIIPFITYVVEALRLMVTVGPYKSDFTRKLLSVSLGIFDVMNGEWKKGIMSLLGLFGETPSLIGAVGRNFLTIWNYIAPDIQNDLTDNVFSASKSLISGFWLNMISTFAPEDVRDIINKVLGKLRPLASNYNKQMAQIQERAQAEASKLGYTIQFPKLPLDDVPSADDLINVITILRRPEVICSKEMWGAIQPLLDEPILRILLELFLIPTSQEAHQAKCQGISTNLPKAAADAMERGITLSPLPQSHQQDHEQTPETALEIPRSNQPLPPSQVSV